MKRYKWRELNHRSHSLQQSFDNFTAELCGSLKAVLMAYVDCSSATAATNAQMVEHPRMAIESVDIARDGQFTL
jgi:hypothetical protein